MRGRIASPACKPSCQSGPQSSAAQPAISVHAASAERRERAIPLERVLSSPWCRCLETARLAFAREAEVSQAPSNLFGRSENRERQVRELQSLISSPSGKGNLVLVTHGSTIAALTGISPGTGEMVVSYRK